MYHRGDIPAAAADKVLTIPLGYHWTVRDGKAGPLKKTPQLPFRETVWSFFGTDWHGRREAMKPLLEVPGGKSQFFADWKDAANLEKDAYVSAMLDSIFVPCPDGNNAETFRFYEALECGAIPLLVRTEKGAAWTTWLEKNLSMVLLDSWEHAANLVQYLVKNPTSMEAYRSKVLLSWAVWKKEMTKEVCKMVGA